MSDPSIQIPVASNEIDTKPPRPVRSRAKSAALAAPASIAPAIRSPAPPVGCGGTPSACVNVDASPEYAQKAPWS